ncbi:hypothetical protein A3J61_00155 [Candidatus Nomurabacteria bacterium RIFCSPHIGHO2_02_FULL_38_15]|uniref:AB hydrolase-1 domain-containing protein n=1 Tax=Candidatus Nomurabacteria bacterium RIFCSPHIGHO2_02_FULL_38_15 TaxID=1801752 RepID=A0A1F6VSN3_9BACT|nr:MAG: hypothetical protein A3J61_00155 [Candidatus Nomurabacteria bacterium RIFCSPHIGHO2_02_FULL_38_15]
MKKILLLHGWNYANYKNVADNPQVNPWHNRWGFIKTLQGQGFELITPSFPGFVGYPHDDPKNFWTIIDYVKYCDELVNKYQPDAVLGYSFGASVATLWKSTLGLSSMVKIILISPALERLYKKEGMSIFALKNSVPKLVVNFLRDFYLIKVVKNPYYSNGTKFIRGSYLNIVKVRCGYELGKIKSNQLLIIFGSNDTATPVELLKKSLSNNKELLDRITVILGGEHDIANTHVVELVEKIKTYVNEV